MAENERQLIQVTKNISCYQDDPWKLLYRNAKQELTWLKYCSREMALSWNDADDDKIVKTYRGIADTMPQKKGEAWKDTDTIHEAHKKLAELIPDKAYTEALAASEAILVKTVFTRADEIPERSEGPKDVPTSREAALAIKNGKATDIEAFGREYKFSPSQVQLFKDMYAVGASDEELKMFLYTCAKLNLDPSLHQIHFIKRRRWNPITNAYELVASIQVGIDGYRAIANRTRQWDGAEITSEGEEETTFEDKKIKHPTKAIAKIYRRGWQHPVVREAHWEEYAQYNKDGKLQGLWLTKPRIMLEKCAEAIALRTAFPEQLSGTYGEDEVGGKDSQ